jgi:CheY-like chemotaxis protein
MALGTVHRKLALVTASILRRPGRLSAVRALVVEDDQDTREMLVEFLALDGAIVLSAVSGVEGFDVFERERPDVVVSDLWMPGGDGFEMIRRIRAQPLERGKLTPAVAVSAAEAVRPALSAGFHAFAAKPFDIETLVDIIADFTAPDEDVQNPAAWTVATPQPGKMVVAFVGHVRAADMRAMVTALVAHLQGGRCDVVLDLRCLTGCSPSVASVGERGAWAARRQIRGVRIVGGSVLARLVAVSACAVLGVPISIAAQPGD